MKPVIQQARTGCGIAAVAAIAGVSYRQANRVAASLGISAEDDRLWSDTAMVRRLLARYGRRVASLPRPFRSWDGLPDYALLAIKWRRRRGRAFWHWVVFVREKGRACVLDSKPGLTTPLRRDFGRMQPKWYLQVPPTRP
jgi:hypothetical protein